MSTELIGNLWNISSTVLRTVNFPSCHQGQIFLFFYVSFFSTRLLDRNCKEFLTYKIVVRNVSILLRLIPWRPTRPLFCHLNVKRVDKSSSVTNGSPIPFTSSSLYYCPDSDV